MISVSPVSGLGHPAPWEIFPKYFWGTQAIETKSTFPGPVVPRMLVLLLTFLVCTPVPWSASDTLLGKTSSARTHRVHIPYSSVKSVFWTFTSQTHCLSTFSCRNKVHSMNLCVIHTHQFILQTFANCLPLVKQRDGFRKWKTQPPHSRNSHHSNQGRRQRNSNLQ